MQLVEKNLCIITHRPDWKPDFIDSSHVSNLQLTKLGREHGLQIIEKIRNTKISKEMALHIINRTDGIPLFVEELTRTIVGSGLKGLNDDYNISDTLQGTLLARLDRLSNDVRALIQIGPVTGPKFGLAFLTSVIGENLGDISETNKYC